MPKPNAIVVCCTQNWLPLAAATLLSCAEHGADDLADLYTIVFEAAPADRERLTHFATGRGVKIEVIDGILPPALQAMWDARVVNPGILLRMALDHYLPREYQRVLYLDCDILALGPLGELFATELNGNALGAVEDWHSMPGPLRRFLDHPRAIGLPHGTRYFNAGMLLFDWQKTLQQDLLGKSVALWSERIARGTPLPMMDQDALNLGFAKDWQPLPVTFNTAAVMCDYFREPPTLLHFSGWQKPWGKMWMPGLAPYKERYRALLGNDWPEFPIPDFSKTRFADMAGVFLRRVDFLTAARYRAHVKAGLAPQKPRGQ